MNNCVLTTTSHLLKLPTRSLHTSRFLHSNYGILVGGGTDGRLPSRISQELAFDGDIKQMNRAMKLACFSDIKILFGDRAITRTSNLCLVSSIYSKIFGKRQIQSEQSENLIDKTPVANFETAMAAFTKKMVHGDRLWIYVSGHGSDEGVFLSQNKTTTQFLTPHFIHEQLKKLPEGISTTLLVDACRSGIFQNLSSNKVCVLSSSDAQSPSFYIDGSTVTRYLHQFFDQGNTDLLTLFSIGSAEVRNDTAISNDTATDSFTHYIDSHFAKKNWNEQITLNVQELDLSFEMKNKVEFILKNLSRLKKIHKNNQRSKYYSLYDKAVYFIKTASKEQIYDLVAIGELLLRPFKNEPQSF